MGESFLDYAIGIDIGGTNIKLIAVGMGGQLLSKKTTETLENNPAWPQRVRDLCANVEAELSKPASHTGISAPGLADASQQCIKWMPGRLPGLENLNWKKFLKRSHPVPVLNDAHSALLGEIWQGAAKNCDNVVLLTLGTGVGGAVVSDGRLLRGHIGRAGVLGHICLDVEGELDVCNTPGSLEEAIGECSLDKRSSGKFKSTRELLSSYRDGDVKAKEIWLCSVKHLACGIVSIINVVDPELILIGGGIAQAKDSLLQPLRQYLDNFEWRPGGSSVDVRLAKMEGWAGAYGAAYYAIEKASEINSE